MANTIKLKRGSGSDPGSSDLSVGELAIRTDTAKLFTKNDAGSVAEIGGGTDATKMPLAGGTFTGDVIFGGAGTNITFDQSADDFVFNDGAKAVFGTGLDFQIFFDGNHARLNTEGNFNVQADVISFTNKANTEVLADFTANGSVDLYYNNVKKFETRSDGAGMPDATALFFGASDDLKITESSGNALIDAQTGTLYLDAEANISVRTTGGSIKQAIFCNTHGSVDLYHNNSLKISTQSYGASITGTLTASGNIKLATDTGGFYAGAGDDLAITHTGSFGKIQNSTGDLNLYADTNVGIYNAAGTETKALFATNGAVKLYFDNSLKFQTTTNGVQIDGRLFTNGADYNYLTSNSSTNATLTLKKTDSNADSIDYLQLRNNANSAKFIINGDGSVVMYDNSKLKLGNSADLQIYHDGTNSYLANSTGVLRIRSDDLRLQSSTGEEYFYGVANGGAHLYHNNALKLQTTSTGISVDGNISAGDNDHLYLGDSQDINIYHDGTDSYFYTGAGTTTFRDAANEKFADFIPNGEVRLFYDNSKKFETASAGISVTGEVSTTGHIRIPDNMSLIAGTGSDLFIYHNGTHNYIDTVSNKLHIRVADGENAIVANSNGAVELYYNATKRLETVDVGANVTGNLGVNTSNPKAFTHASDGVTTTIFEAVASNSANSIFESGTFRGGADHNGAGARVRLCHSGDRGLVLEGGRTSNAAFGAIGLTDQNGGITSSVHIDSAGTWFWGKTSQSSGTPGVELYKDGPHFMTRSAGGGTVLGLNDSTGTSGGIMKFYFQDVHKGSLQFTGSTFQTATASDYRLKENDVAISDGITRLKLLRPVRFNWKTDASKTYDGFIAHEVTPAVPEAVVGEKDGEISKRGEGYQMICQQTLIPLLTAALKEAVSKIELLEARVTTLEAA